MTDAQGARYNNNSNNDNNNDNNNNNNNNNKLYLFNKFSKQTQF